MKQKKWKIVLNILRIVFYTSISVLFFALFAFVFKKDFFPVCLLSFPITLLILMFE